jgi:glutamyl-Q tRNA(Asp) synthetase
MTRPVCGEKSPVSCAPIVTRFAPSPTGLLHAGHARSALFAWRRAREAGGRFLLRIEDIDTTRCKPEYEAAILEDLAWLGLDWDGEPRRQSEHFSEYARALDSLRSRGLLYPCFCTREEIAREIAAADAAPHGPEGPVYPGTCIGIPAPLAAVRIAQGAPHAWRLRMNDAVAVTGPLTYEEEGRGTVHCGAAGFGDVVLSRKETPASYHLCVTHDDAVQGVNVVTRGEDLRAATDIHRLLQALMGWPIPRYAHHPLMLDSAGRRLAKRDGSLSLRALRESGRTPAGIREMVGHV